MGTISSSEKFGTVLADAHVHFHSCFEISQVLNSASLNFKTFAKKLCCENDYIGVLFLAEMQSEHRFKQLYGVANTFYNCVDEGIHSGNWKFYRTDERFSLLAKFTTDQPLILLGGRQIVTQEGLEVLALITDNLFEEGLPLSETLEAIISDGGFPVLPWGAGKWLGRRGDILRKVLRSQRFSPLFLGDNGGRPSFWPTPSYFRWAENHGMPILPGTDPLPLGSEYKRAGSYGFRVKGPISLTNPGNDIKQMLLHCSSTLKAYGYLEKPSSFLRNQFAIRQKKLSSSY